MTNVISSIQNDRVKQWKKLHTAKGRKKENCYLIETWHLIEEAQKANRLIECMLTQQAYDTYKQAIYVPVTIITDEISQVLTQTITPTGVFGVVKMSFANTPIQKGKWLLLDNVQDPGNVGTMIRTADAAGFHGVVIGEGCVDVFNDKTVRAMQGSQFHIELYKGDLLHYISQLQTEGVSVYGSQLHEKSMTLFDLPYMACVGLVVGNEGSGVSQHILDNCTSTVYIPMIGQAESLNVAVAASVMMYHFVKGNYYEN